MTQLPNHETELLVLGGGPGGYAAAFYAADLGKKVIVVELEEALGGVCLHRGCIPSKALLHATHLLEETQQAHEFGFNFQKPEIDLNTLRAWKKQTIDTLARGISSLAKSRNVEVLKGRGYFEDKHTLRVETTKGQIFINFQQAIIAVGSRANLPSAFDLGNPRIMTSRAALELEDVPETLLVIGGGYIGMELGSVYSRLGSKTTLVEAENRLLTGIDKDLITPVIKSARSSFSEIHLSTNVLKMATQGKQIRPTIRFADGVTSEPLFDRVLVSVGRHPRTQNIGLENTAIQTDQRGFIQVNETLQTDEPSISAIGDCIGGAMLAHKAHHEAKTAIDALYQPDEPQNTPQVPAVVFTDPEIAWCGTTEAQAKEESIPFKTAKFPWSTSGRAISVGRGNGFTKILIDPETERILGMGIVGNGAGELISEGTLAIEMGATAYDLAKTIHPHPTLSETIMEAAELFYGHATHFRSTK